MVDNSLSEYIKKALSDGFAPEEINLLFYKKAGNRKISTWHLKLQTKPEQNSSQKTPEKILCLVLPNPSKKF
jgi:hypothetical protein